MDENRTEKAIQVWNNEQFKKKILSPLGNQGLFTSYQTYD